MKTKIQEHLLKLNNIVMGKTIKINSMKSLVNISLSILLLTTACGQGDTKTKEKVYSGTEVNAAVDAPSIDIQAAILSNNIEAVEQHIQAGTDLNKKDAMSGSTPLITAASFGKIEIAQKLIDAGVNLTAKNNDGATALHTAAFFGRVEIVQMLIDSNVDKSVQNNFGATARESVMGPFEEMKPIYEMLKQQLEPLGMQIDLAEIEKTRPVIAMMLQ
jgi:ankyrin repeat protein